MSQKFKFSKFQKKMSKKLSKKFSQKFSKKFTKISSKCWVFEKNSGSHFTFFRHGESDFEVIMQTCLGKFSNELLSLVNSQALLVGCMKTVNRNSKSEME